MELFNCTRQCVLLFGETYLDKYQPLISAFQEMQFYCDYECVNDLKDDEILKILIAKTKRALKHAHYFVLYFEAPFKFKLPTRLQIENIVKIVRDLKTKHISTCLIFNEIIYSFGMSSVMDLQNLSDLKDLIIINDYPVYLYVNTLRLIKESLQIEPKDFQPKLIVDILAKQHAEFENKLPMLRHLRFHNSIFTCEENDILEIKQFDILENLETDSNSESSSEFDFNDIEHVDETLKNVVNAFIKRKSIDRISVKNNTNDNSYIFENTIISTVPENIDDGLVQEQQDSDDSADFEDCNSDFEDSSETITQENFSTNEYQCLVINNQNCDENIINSVKSKLELELFYVKVEAPMTVDAMKSRLFKELEKSQTTVFLVCIFASHTSESASSGKGFFCLNGETCCVEELASHLLEACQQNKSIEVYVTINDKAKCENEFHFAYQKSNVYISFNTYHYWWFSKQLCANFKSFTNNLCEQKDCESFLNFDCFQEVDKMENMPTDKGYSLNNFEKTFYSLSTNTHEHHNSNEYVEVTSDKILEKEDTVYIINFAIDSQKGSEFVKQFDYESDIELLKNTFKGLGFQVNSHNGRVIDDDTYNDGNTIYTMDNFFNKLRKFNWSPNKCFILCIITYHEDGEIYLDRSRKYPLKKIIDFLRIINSQPKMLLIHNVFKKKSQNVATSSNCPMKALKHLTNMPKNILFIYSSFGNDVKSTFFIPILCDMIRNQTTNISDNSKKDHNRYDLMTMIHLATMKMKKCLLSANIDTNSQTSVLIKSTLENFYYFKFNSKCLEIRNLYRTTNLEDDRFKITTNHTTELPIEYFENVFYPYNKARGVILSYGCDKTVDDNIEILKKTFEKLGIELDPLVNQNIESWTIFDIGTESNPNPNHHENFNCFIVFFIGYPFEPDRHKWFNTFNSYIGFEKPKLFFVLDSNNHEKKNTTCCFDGPNDENSNDTKIYCIPEYCNFLYFYSSEVLETLKLLISEFENHKTHYDLNTTLTNVMQKVNNKLNQKNNLCYYNTTLVYPISFQIGYNPKENNTCEIIKNRGICYIFDYENFRNKRYNRKGNKLDVEKIKKFFEKINFEINDDNNDLCNGCTLNRLKEIQKNDFSNYGCVVFCCFTHGHENGDLQSYNGHFNQMDIIVALAENETLKNKPKIVFIEACQGDISDGVHRKYVTTKDGAAVDAIKSNTNNTKSESPCYNAYENDKTNQTNIQECKSPQWKYPDLFVFTSSLSGYVSKRNTDLGCIFIEKLCNVLDTYFDKYDLVTIAALVCKGVGYEAKKTNDNVQVPLLHTTMNYSFKFKDFTTKNSDHLDSNLASEENPNILEINQCPPKMA